MTVNEEADTLRYCTDCCSECDKVNKPYYVAKLKPTAIRAYYKCKCGHSWFTSWELQFALDHARGVLAFY